MAEIKLEPWSPHSWVSHISLQPWGGGRECVFNNNQKKPEFEFELGDVGESWAPQDWQRPKVNSIFLLMF